MAYELKPCAAFDALSLALQWYPPKKLQHALKVAEYSVLRWTGVFNSEEIDRDVIPVMPEGAMEELWIVYFIGLFHDIIEDSECPIESVYAFFAKYFDVEYAAAAVKSLALLTHKEGESYADYMRILLNSNDRYAKHIKSADMKDHWMRKDTLSDKLIEKYKPYVGLLM